MLREMEALDLFAQGRHAEALALMDRAASLQARMPKPIGRPFPVKDVNELYGELLLQLNRPTEAIMRFDRVLARTPNRSRALLGLARAYRNAGDAANARAAYKRFLTNYRQADAGLPEVAEARDAAEMMRPSSRGRRRCRRVRDPRGCSRVRAARETGRRSKYPAGVPR